jgi:hypothetical protein
MPCFASVCGNPGSPYLPRTFMIPEKKKSVKTRRLKESGSAIGGTLTVPPP